MYVLKVFLRVEAVAQAIFPAAKKTRPVSDPARRTASPDPSHFAASWKALRIFSALRGSKPLLRVPRWRGTSREDRV